MYKDGEKPSAYTLIKLQNAIKKTETPFFMEVGKCAPQYAIHNLEYAFKSFFKKNTKYPKFKKKGVNDSFVAIENSLSFSQSNKKIWIPRLGWVKCAEDLRFDGKVLSVTVKRKADMWFAVVNMETKEIPVSLPMDSENQAAVGIDMGIKSMLVLSDGTVYENPKALKKNLKSLKRLQRSMSRKVKGSNNRYKQRIKVARKHYRISCIRKDAIHRATTDIVAKHDRIVIETLKPQNMVKNRKLAQAVGDVSFGEISRQLAYKCQWQGKELVKADQWFASSKICSCCGNKKTVLKLSERTYICEVCGTKIDRDLNAAKNLAKYSPTPKLGGSNACEDGSPVAEMQHSPSAKQEVVLFSSTIKNKNY